MKRTRKQPVTKSIAPDCPNHQPSHEEIAAFAFSIWEQAGRPHGSNVEHWLQAEAQLRLANFAAPE